MIEYSYDPPYNLWSGNRSDTLNKWKINYKGSIATASALPEKGDFKGDTYNVLEDGSNYMWNGSSWDKLDANVYVGATSTKDGIQGLVPPADSSERNKFLRGNAGWDDVAWDMIVGKPLTFTPSVHTHDWDDITNEPDFALDDDVVHKTGNETIAGKKTFTEYNYQVNNNPTYIMVIEGIANDGSLVNDHATSGFDWYDKDQSKAWAVIKYSYAATSHELWFALRSRYDNSILNSLHFVNFQGNGDFLFYPEGDGNTYLGGSNRRWKTVFASTGTINTSDKRLKSFISEIPDNVLDAWGNVNFVKYKFKDAIEQKGESARFHSGLIAQQIDEAFQSCGIDAREYGLFCWDQWEAESEQVDEAGNVVRHAMPAGDHYSLRYEEALCMEAAYQRRRAERTEARIKVLEDRLEALEAKLA